MVNRHRTVENLDGLCTGGAISIGNFDGVHRGHQMLLQRLRAMADLLDGPAVVVTFDPSPAAILRPGGVPPQLTTIERRTRLLRECGVDDVVVCKTNRELLNQTPDDFFSHLVVDQLKAKGVVEGPNFYFGRNRSGDVFRLRQLCQSHGIAVEIVEPQSDRTSILSSTRVRELLTEGNVEAANELLTEPYQIAGIVVRGSARGREIGFPTANLSEITTLLPGAGVYACRVRVDAHRVLDAAAHIGPNPTFAEARHKVEVHLLDFSADLYGNLLEVDFIARVRGVIRFPSTAALMSQLEQDVQEIRTRLRATV